MAKKNAQRQKDDDQVESVSASEIVVIGSGKIFSEADADRIRRAVRSRGLGPAQLPPRTTRNEGSSIRLRA